MQSAGLMADNASSIAGSRLRLLLVTQHFWPESFRINSFAESLTEAGAEVTVLTGQPNYPEGRVFAGYRASSIRRESGAGGIDIVRVPLIPRGRAGHVRLAANYLSFIASAGLLGPLLLRRRRFDAILVYGTSPIFQAFAAWPLRTLKRAPLAVWVQDLWPNVLAGTGYVRNRRLLVLVGRAVEFLYRRSDLLLGQSPAFVEAIRPLAGATPVEYLPNPGDPARAGPPAAADAFPLAAGFNLVFAGNLGRAQALDTVVEAAEILRSRSDITIWLFGSGAMAGELAEAVREKKLANVRLSGRVAPEEVGPILVQADAALLTLVDDPVVAKTVPSKLQTYLAAAVPVVVAAGGEAARIAGEAGVGTIAPPGDPRALAAAIAAMADLPAAERAAMGKRAERYYAEHFEPHTLADWLVARLRRLAADTGDGKRE